MFSAAAQECHLYPMELEHARHTLVEARKVSRGFERWGDEMITEVKYGGIIRCKMYGLVRG